MSMVARQVQHQEQTEIKRKRVVRRARFRVTKGEKFLVALMVMLSFVVIGYIIQNSASIYGINKEITQLETTVNAQQDIVEGYNQEAEALKNPERILEIAFANGLELDDGRVKVVNPNTNEN